MSNLLTIEQGCKQINNIEAVVSFRNNNIRQNNHRRKLNLVSITRNYLNITPPCLQNEGQLKMALFNVRSIAGKKKLSMISEKRRNLNRNLG